MLLRGFVIALGMFYGYVAGLAIICLGWFYHKYM